MIKVIEHDPATAKAVEIPRAQAVTPIDMLDRALGNGAGIDVIERLMTLHERYQAAEARRAFIDAKAAFKAEAPSIEKDKKNLQYKSKYSSIGAIVNTMNPILSKHGLDASWDIDQSDADIKVTCTLSHRDGHSQSVPMRSKPDGTGQKNPIQQIKSAITYLKIATYEAVVGIASNEANSDDDGNASQEIKLISEKQLDELLALADRVGADKAKFCELYEVEGFAQIHASKFLAAKNALLQKEKRKSNEEKANG